MSTGFKIRSHISSTVKTMEVKYILFVVLKE